MRWEDCVSRVEHKHLCNLTERKRNCFLFVLEGSLRKRRKNLSFNSIINQNVNYLCTRYLSLNVQRELQSWTEKNEK